MQKRTTNTSIKSYFKKITRNRNHGGTDIFDEFIVVDKENMGWGYCNCRYCRGKTNFRDRKSYFRKGKTWIKNGFIRGKIPAKSISFWNDGGYRISCSGLRKVKPGNSSRFVTSSKTGRFFLKFPSRRIKKRKKRIPRQIPARPVLVLTSTARSPPLESYPKREQKIKYLAQELGIKSSISVSAGFVGIKKRNVFVNYSGHVSQSGEPRCVVVSGRAYDLPYEDRVMSKVLTILYRPELISTLGI